MFLLVAEKAKAAVMPLLFCRYPTSAAANAKDSLHHGIGSQRRRAGLHSQAYMDGSMPRPKAEASAIKLSALWLALGYLAKKRGVRALVAAGSSTPIEIEITAKVGRANVCESITGTLNIGADTETADVTNADVNDLLALVLREAGDADKQAALLAKIKRQFDANKGMLPVIPKVEIERVEMWRKGFAASGMKPKAGNLTFSPSPNKAAA